MSHFLASDDLDRGDGVARDRSAGVVKRVLAGDRQHVADLHDVEHRSRDSRRDVLARRRRGTTKGVAAHQLDHKRRPFSPQRVGVRGIVGDMDLSRRRAIFFWAAALGNAADSPSPGDEKVDFAKLRRRG